MYEILTHLSENPSQNFNNNSSILKNPKIFQKPQNLGFKTWNAWIWTRLEAYQVKKNLKKLEETLRIKIGVRWDCLGEKKKELSRERSNEMGCGPHEEFK